MAKASSTAVATGAPTPRARIFAFTALSMVPALGFFVLAERRIVAGLTGSLKG